MDSIFGRLGEPISIKEYDKFASISKTDGEKVVITFFNVPECDDVRIHFHVSEDVKHKHEVKKHLLTFCHELLTDDPFSFTVVKLPAFLEKFRTGSEDAKKAGYEFYSVANSHWKIDSIPTKKWHESPMHDYQKKIFDTATVREFVENPKKFHLVFCLDIYKGKIDDLKSGVMEKWNSK